MQWPEIFLSCLGAGFLFSVLAAVSGAVHLPHIHLHIHGHGGHATAKGGAFSPVTIAAFLLWFGASGYLLTRLSDWRMLMVLGVAALCGATGAALVFWFFAHILLAADQPLDPADYDMTGVLGRLSSNVRPGGTGELIFTQAGRRCGVPARSESGDPLEQGVEVVVTRYEGGIAYVRAWHEMASRY